MATLSHTSPTGFSSVPPPGARDAGDADADVRAEARARPVRERPRDLRGDGAVALDQPARDVRLETLTSLE